MSGLYGSNVHSPAPQRISNYPNQAVPQLRFKQPIRAHPSLPPPTHSEHEARHAARTDLHHALEREALAAMAKKSELRQARLRLKVAGQ